MAGAGGGGRCDPTVCEEDYFRTLVENAPDLITVTDAAGTIRYVSPSVDRLLGYDPRDLEGRDVTDFVHADDLRALGTAFRRCLRGSGETFSVPLRLRGRGGQYRRFQANGTNQLNDPAVAGIIVNSRDTTEQQELQEQLYHAQKMEAVGSLAGGVAHDFNNLLTAVFGNVEYILSELPAGSPLLIEVEEIRDAAERAALLTRQLLAFSRRQAMERRPLSISDVVAGAERVLRRMLGAPVELVCELATDLPATLGDPGQLEQVIVNLALNARDAMPTGGRLTIRTRHFLVDDCDSASPAMVQAGHVVLTVTDTGVGMEPHVRDRIFEPFFTTKEFGAGTGLGLATVFGIVQQCGGFIRVRTEPGSGTTFAVHLPIHEVGKEDEEPELQPSKPGACQRGTVLLAEDDDAVRSLAVRTLKAAGYRVVQARTGQDAVRLVRSAACDPDILITDIVMHQMSGVQLAHTLREDRADMPVLYISGHSEVDVQQLIVDAASEQFLAKPFAPAELVKRVASLLAKARR